MLSEVHTIEKQDFLKPISHYQIKSFLVVYQSMTHVSLLLNNLVGFNCVLYKAKLYQINDKTFLND